MTSPPDDRLRVMPWWLVLIGLLLAVALGWWVLDWLLGEADRAAQPDTRATLRIDAIRTGLTVVAGTGGGLALLLAARRQWISERAQRHQESVAAADQAHRERVQAHTEAVTEAGQRHQEQQAVAAAHDAAERRLTELYTRAVELLGNDNAAVRLGGLHALERLGQDNPTQRTTIGAVLCAYLRMMPSQDDARETEVRRTAQRVLTRHLRADGDQWWPEVTVDLTGARLDGFDASGCTLVDADLTGAVCTGVTRLTGATVRGRLSLRGTFDELFLDDVGGDGEITLDGARAARVGLDGADLAGTMSCRGVTFGRLTCRGTTFREPVTFDVARIEESATFREAVFLGGLSMERMVFGGYAGFRQARFADLALFRFTEFGGETWFKDARFAGAANFGRARFSGPVSFHGATFTRRPLVDQARAAASVPHTWPEGVSPAPLDDDWLLLTDP